MALIELLSEAEVQPPKMNQSGIHMGVSSEALIAGPNHDPEFSATQRPYKEGIFLWRLKTLLAT